MNRTFLTITRILGFVVTLYIWRVIQFSEFTRSEALAILIVPMLLVFPTTWIGRRTVDDKPTLERLAWITSFVHVLLMIFFGASIIEAIRFFQLSPGPKLPIPVEVSAILLYFTGSFLFLTVVNLALGGYGAPFAIALSKRIASSWLYSWTRNPMVLGTLAVLVSTGFYLQSLFFVLWVALLVAPALLYFLKVYEERELELRFGKSYLGYKATTPFLWPRKPNSWSRRKTPNA